MYVHSFTRHVLKQHFTTGGVRPQALPLGGVEECQGRRECIKKKCDPQTNAEFPIMNVDDFWLNYFPVYPQIVLEAAKLLAQFSSIYFCESGLSTLAYIKLKYRQK